MRRPPDPYTAGQSLLHRYIAADPASVKLLNEIHRIAVGSSTVLLRGEAGTGKGLVASLLHYLSARASEPLVRLDCAALTPELIESELFGHERLGFQSGRGKCGYLELAGEGTLVLDEVAALSMPLQARLLRVLEEKSFHRLGGARQMAMEARVIALTTVDLERAVARRSFREDLYYLLNVVPVFVPPLRDRPGDIAAMAMHFLAVLGEINRKPRLSFSAGAVAALERYPYPGNVRELRTVVERAVLAAEGGEVGLGDLPPAVRSAAAEGKPSLEEVERAYIREVLDHTRGKKTQAAHILGISRKTLLEKRKKYGMG